MFPYRRFLPQSRLVGVLRLRQNSTLQAVQQLANLLQDQRPRQTVETKAVDRAKLGSLKLKSELAIEISEGYNKLPPVQLCVSNSNSCQRKEILNFISLREGSTPKYEGFLEYILRQNVLVSMPFIISLREDLLRILHDTSEIDDVRLLADLKSFNRYLQDLLSSWFCPDLLEIRRITYDQTAASIIEVIAKKEAVHPIQSLDDLRNRLGKGRRVFALFSPLLEQPLVWCYVIFTEEIPSSLSKILDSKCDSNPKPKVATFYSISNGQPGLVGLQLGQHLLKQSIKLLQTENSSIASFVTLSPMPGFKDWLDAKLHKYGSGGKFHDNTLISDDDVLRLKNIGITVGNNESFLKVLKTFEQSNRSKDQEYIILKEILEALGSQYLLSKERHRGKPLDGVCRFHVGNGAQVHRLNFGADLSQRGIEKSYSLMVNYLYDIDNDKIAENQARYEAGGDVPASPEVLGLVGK